MNAPSVPTYLHYTLTLRSPVIVSTRSGDPNGAATQPFIPGSVIRGTVAARLLARGKASNSAEFRDLVLSGTVRYLNAYPIIAGERGLPAPSSWRRQKDKLDASHDLAAYSGDVTNELEIEDFADVWPEEALTGVGAPFVAAAASSGSRTVHRPRIDARLHQQRDRVMGRPWKEPRGGGEVTHGAIFAYEYLEPDQAFAGVIQAMPVASAHLPYIKALLADPILIGRSRRAGYGGEGAIAFTSDGTREYANVAGLLTQQVEAGTRFRALLTSAYIGRDPSTGQIDPLALNHEIERRLGGTASVERRRWSFDTVGGFNQKWRLPLPQTLSVAAGAVLVLEAGQPISLEMLSEIEHEGLGERRTEGFGRILFLVHGESRATIRLDAEPRRRVTTPVTAVVSTAGQGQAPQPAQGQLAFLERRIVLAAAVAELERVVADIAGRVNQRDIPTSSLLGRLRTVFRIARDPSSVEAALQTLSTWCGNDSSKALKERARQQLDNCTVGEKNLRGWLRDLASPPDGTSRWQALVWASANASSLIALAQGHHLSNPDDAQAVLNDHASLLSMHLADGLLAALALCNRGGAR